MTREEFAIGLSMLEAVGYPPGDKTTKDAQFAMLKDLPSKAFAEGISRICREKTTFEFGFNPVATIREYALEAQRRLKHEWLQRHGIDGTMLAWIEQEHGSIKSMTPERRIQVISEFKETYGLNDPKRIESNKKAVLRLAESIQRSPAQTEADIEKRRNHEHARPNYR